MFLAETTKIDFNPKQVVDTKYTILESITSKPKREKPTQISETLRKEERDTQLLSYQILVDKFNKKYTNLSESQKSLLREYINNISNSNSFGKFINEEITKVVNELKPLLKKVNDKVVKIKLTEAVNQIDNLECTKTMRGIGFERLERRTHRPTLSFAVVSAAHRSSGARQGRESPNRIHWCCALSKTFPN